MALAAQGVKPLHPRITLAALGSGLASAAATLLTAAGPLHTTFGAHGDAIIATASIVSAGSGLVAALGRSIVPQPPEFSDVRNFAQSHTSTDPLELSNLRNLESSATSPQLARLENTKMYFRNFIPSASSPATAPESSLPQAAGVTGKKAQDIMDSPFVALLKQAGLALVDVGVAELEANKEQVVASAQAAGASAVSLVSNEIETAISSSNTGVLGKVAAPIVKSIADKAAQQVITGLGGEANALYALADNELRKLAANLGGSSTPTTASASPSTVPPKAAPSVPSAGSGTVESEAAPAVQAA